MIEMCQAVKRSMWSSVDVRSAKNAEKHVNEVQCETEFSCC